MLDPIISFYYILNQIIAFAFYFEYQSLPISISPEIVNKNF